MSQIKDLTSGNIFSQILKLAIPIIATSFVQIAYNMTDMVWPGRVGSKTVSAVGKAMPPTVVGIIGNVLRIPFAYILAYSIVDLLPLFSDYISQNSVPVTGVWWGITISSILKGVFLFFGFLILLIRHPENDQELPFQKKWINLLPSRIGQQAAVIVPLKKPRNK